MSSVIARTEAVLSEYAPYRFTDDELAEGVYWAQAKWDAHRAAVDALGLKRGPYEPINPEWVACDAAEMLCSRLGPIEIYVRATGRLLKSVSA